MSTILPYILVGFAIGLASGTFGIGGGVLLIPILIWLFPQKFDQFKAAGTSLAALTLPVLLPAAWQHWSLKHVDIPAAAGIAVGIAVGAFLGARALPYFPRTGVAIAFGLLLIYIGIQFVFVSKSEVLSVIVGLAATGLSLIAYLVLRAIGKKYKPRKLAEEIRRRQEDPPHEPEYYI